MTDESFKVASSFGHKLTCTTVPAIRPLTPPTPPREPIRPRYTLNPASPYWINYKYYLAPIPGTNDSCAKLNPYYIDHLKLEEESAERTKQMDVYLTYQENVKIAAAENTVTQLKTKQANRKHQVAKTQQLRQKLLLDRALAELPEQHVFHEEEVLPSEADLASTESGHLAESGAQHE
jgi:hypothetical protein